MDPRTTISELAPLVRSGELSPRAVVERCLAQIDSLDARISAWVVVDADGALEAADQLGLEAKEGRWRGPLHGIPIGIKDIIDVAGLPTRAGSSLTPPTPVVQDAPLVAALRKAGAIILGKTVTTEFACFDPPPTRNPWNLDRTPGGSSSGSAAAVAAGMCVAAVGSQTGGSITRPASFCGVVGCKPTHGGIDLAGILPVSPRLDHAGPIARSVSDATAVLAVMSAASGASGGNRPSFADLSPLPAPPRLGLVKDFFLEAASADVADVVKRTAEKLQSAGAAITIAALPASFDDVLRFHRRIMAFEAAQVHYEMYREHFSEFGPQVAGLLEEGLEVTPEEFETSLAHQRRFRDDLEKPLAECDALLTPATTTTAPLPDTTGDPSFNSPWSYAGVPAVNVPCGLGEDGMPVAIQLVGRAGEESRLLAVAAWCEQIVAFTAGPALGASEKEGSSG